MLFTFHVPYSTVFFLVCQLCLFQLVSLSAATSFAHILCFTKGEDSSSSSGGGGSAPSKTDSGRGNGPLPLGGSGLMEEMSALLARR